MTPANSTKWNPGPPLSCALGWVCPTWRRHFGSLRRAYCLGRRCPQPRDSYCPQPRDSYRLSDRSWAGGTGQHQLFVSRMWNWFILVDVPWMRRTCLPNSHRDVSSKINNGVGLKPPISCLSIRFKHRQHNMSIQTLHHRLFFMTENSTFELDMLA